MSSFIVEPKSRADLRALARQFRKYFFLDNCLYFPIVELLDIMSEIFNDFSYEIVEDNVFAENIHADTDITTGHIRIKESVYDGACNGDGRDRMTIAHEIGHFLTLRVCGFKLTRNFFDIKTVPYRDPEWQAKCFAGELMVAAHLVQGMNECEIAERCGVSYQAAHVQYTAYRKG